VGSIVGEQRVAGRGLGTIVDCSVGSIINKRSKDIGVRATQTANFSRATVSLGRTR